MNRGRKIKQMRKFINTYGEIKTEYKTPPSRHYRKGGYYAQVLSEPCGLILCIGGKNRYDVYKEVVHEIKYVIGGNIKMKIENEF